MADTVRRSGRVRKKNSRYFSEQIEEEEVEDLGPEQDDSDISSFEHIENAEDDEDDEVLAISEDEDFAQALEEEEEDDDDDEPGEEPEGDLLIDLDAIRRPVAITTPKIKKSAARKSDNRNSARRRYAGYRDDGLRSRGLMLHNTILSKEVTVGELAGYDEVLTGKMKIERSKYGSTMTLPFRKSRGPGQSDMQYPEVFDEAVREHEKQSFLNWYNEQNGWEIMKKIQATNSLDEQFKSLYVPTAMAPQNLLLGPYQAQYHFVLDYHDSISVSEAWRTAVANAPDSQEYDEFAHDRSSWILNLGSRILACKWAPSQSTDYQFLAIAVDKDRPADMSRISALEAEEPYEAAVQIWAFKTKIKDEITVMDISEKPRLVHVICAKWGVVRRLSWCPVSVSIEENKRSIGTLAMVSTDGYIRVVDVCVDIKSNNPYVKYESTALLSKPPDTICTCLTWLSGDMLAAGCADGHVAIWSMDRVFQAQKSMMDQTGQPISSAIPFWYHPLHTTYILSIVAHQPYPAEYITTNCIDGRVRSTSLRNPYADTVYGSRERHMMPPLAYSPHILGIYEIDETDGLRARPLRHMPVSRSVGKAPAQVMCMDVGKVHPTLMFGCADGNVVLTNPIRRMFIRRILDERVEAWQQTWFKHEFVPETRFLPTDYSTSLQHDMQRKTTSTWPRQGMSRFLESLKLETVSLTKYSQANKDSNAKKNEDPEVEGEDSTPAKRKTVNDKSASQGEIDTSLGAEDAQIAIYEEEQGVTCLCWNPNIKTGGWAAAGMANGLIRVEDLAI